MIKWGAFVGVGFIKYKDIDRHLFHNLGIELDVEDEKFLEWAEREGGIALFSSDWSSYSLRHLYAKHFSFAIPDDLAIKTIAKYSPIVEMGAGSGYWAELISKAGGDIVCFDKRDEKYIFKTQYYPITTGDIDSLERHQDRTLMLCWPNYLSSFAYDCVSKYKNEYLIYIGEGEGGCCADDFFFKYLDDNFEVVEGRDIQQWYGIHDYLVVYKRKK